MIILSEFTKKKSEDLSWKKIKIQSTTQPPNTPEYKQWFAEYIKPINQFAKKHPQYLVD